MVAHCSEYGGSRLHRDSNPPLDQKVPLQYSVTALLAMKVQLTRCSLANESKNFECSVG